MSLWRVILLGYLFCLLLCCASVLIGAPANIVFDLATVSQFGRIHRWELVVAVEAADNTRECEFGGWISFPLEEVA